MVVPSVVVVVGGARLVEMRRVVDEVVLAVVVEVVARAVEVVLVDGRGAAVGWGVRPLPRATTATIITTTSEAPSIQPGPRS